MAQAMTLDRADGLVPSARTIWNLALGGAAGLGIWELFSGVPTPYVAGFALEPPELVKSLLSHQLGLTIDTPTAKGLHYLTGILFYPLAYWVLTKFVLKFGPDANGWIWGIATWFIALGFFAPLAGQPFLLYNLPALSFMSLVGHAIYGWIAVSLFHRLQRVD
jgi:hypothetical protein